MNYIINKAQSLLLIALVALNIVPGAKAGSGSRLIQKLPENLGIIGGAVRQRAGQVWNEYVPSWMPKAKPVTMPMQVSPQDLSAQTAKVQVPGQVYGPAPESAYRSFMRETGSGEKTVQEYFGGKDRMMLTPPPSAQGGVFGKNWQDFLPGVRQQAKSFGARAAEGPTAARIAKSMEGVQLPSGITRGSQGPSQPLGVRGFSTKAPSATPGAPTATLDQGLANPEHSNEFLFDLKPLPERISILQGEVKNAENELQMQLAQQGAGRDKLRYQLTNLRELYQENPELNPKQMKEKYDQIMNEIKENQNKIDALHKEANVIQARSRMQKNEANDMDTLYDIYNNKLKVLDAEKDLLDFEREKVGIGAFADILLAKKLDPKANDFLKFLKMRQPRTKGISEQTWFRVNAILTHPEFGGIITWNDLRSMFPKADEYQQIKKIIKYESFPFYNQLNYNTVLGMRLNKKVAGARENLMKLQKRLGGELEERATRNKEIATKNEAAQKVTEQSEALFKQIREALNPTKEKPSATRNSFMEKLQQAAGRGKTQFENLSARLPWKQNEKLKLEKIEKIDALFKTWDQKEKAALGKIKNLLTDLQKLEADPIYKQERAINSELMQASAKTRNVDWSELNKFNWENGPHLRSIREQIQKTVDGLIPIMKEELPDVISKKLALQNNLSRLTKAELSEKDLVANISSFKSAVIQKAKDVLANYTRFKDLDTIARTLNNLMVPTRLDVASSLRRNDVDFLRNSIENTTEHIAKLEKLQAEGVGYSTSQSGFAGPVDDLLASARKEKETDTKDLKKLLDFGFFSQGENVGATTAVEYAKEQMANIGANFAQLSPEQKKVMAGVVGVAGLGSAAMIVRSGGKKSDVQGAGPAASSGNLAPELLTPAVIKNLTQESKQQPESPVSTVPLITASAPTASAPVVEVEQVPSSPKDSDYMGKPLVQFTPEQMAQIEKSQKTQLEPAPGASAPDVESATQVSSSPRDSDYMRKPVVQFSPADLEKIKAIQARSQELAMKPIAKNQVPVTESVKPVVEQVAQSTVAVPEAQAPAAPSMRVGRMVAPQVQGPSPSLEMMYDQIERRDQARAELSATYSKLNELRKKESWLGIHWISSTEYNDLVRKGVQLDQEVKNLNKAIDQFGL